jgi:hypothetical protein
MKLWQWFFVAGLFLTQLASADEVGKLMPVGEVTLIAENNFVVVKGVTRAPFIVSVEPDVYKDKPEYWAFRVIGIPNDKAGRCENDVCAWEVKFRPESFDNFPLSILKRIIDNPGIEIARPHPANLLGKTGIEVKSLNRSVFLSWQDKPKFIKTESK